MNNFKYIFQNTDKGKKNRKLLVAIQLTEKDT